MSFEIFFPDSTTLVQFSLAGPTLYQPRGKERVWSNPIHDLVSIAQRFGGGHAQNVTIRHGSQTDFFARALTE